MSHKRLLAKLQRVGIDGYLLRWLEEFITGRTCRVRVNSAVSEPFYPTSSVVQGSVLGPLLFLIYISDVTDFIPRDVKLFAYADDIRVYKRVAKKSLEPCASLQEAVNGIHKKSGLNGLPMSDEKTVLVCVGDKNSQRRYDLGGAPLLPSQSARDLGLTLRNDLRTTDHVKKVANAANCRLFLLLRALRTCNTRILLRGYTSYVRPIVESFTCAFNPISRQEIDVLERVQKQFTRAVFWRMTKSNPPAADSIPNYAKRCEHLQLESLELRRQRFDLLAAYRHLNKEPPFEDNQLLQLRPRTARLGPALHKPLGRTRARRASFRYRVSSLINAAVPPSVFQCKNYSAFKRAIRLLDPSTLSSYFGLV